MSVFKPDDVWIFHLQPCHWRIKFPASFVCSSELTSRRKLIGSPLWQAHCRALYMYIVTAHGHCIFVCNSRNSHRLLHVFQLNKEKTILQTATTRQYNVSFVFAFIKWKGKDINAFKSHILRNTWIVSSTAGVTFCAPLFTFPLW